MEADPPPIATWPPLESIANRVAVPLASIAPPLFESESDQATTFSFPEVEDIPASRIKMLLCALRVMVRSTPAVFTTSAWNRIAPKNSFELDLSVMKVSMVTSLRASSAATAEAWMLDAAAEGEIQSPSIKEPFEFGLEVMLT